VGRGEETAEGEVVSLMCLDISRVGAGACSYGRINTLEIAARVLCYGKCFHCLTNLFLVYNISQTPCTNTSAGNVGKNR
jgi:hypothetical protein